ncbi:hypothetical protein XOCgx_4402 [Xanthomonas oryzae pv. oryzicola]|nr:hypothetical protein XOCgx_4402 [Xanthomonas oryzae pv. oryzicola]
MWSDTKRTGVARRPLRSGEKLADRVHDQLSDIAARPELVRAFFRHPSVAYISDLWVSRCLDAALQLSTRGCGHHSSRCTAASTSH